MAFGRWRLSFYSRPKTQLKKLWQDYTQQFSMATSLVSATTNTGQPPITHNKDQLQQSTPLTVEASTSCFINRADFDINRLSLFVLFLDAMVNSIDTNTQLCNLDEVLDEIPTIFKELSTVASLCALKAKLAETRATQSPPTCISPIPNNLANQTSNAQSVAINIADDPSYLQDIISKCLLCLEILCGCSNHFKPSQSIIDNIQSNRQSIRDLLVLCDFPSKSSGLIQVFRLLRFLLSPKSNTDEYLNRATLHRISKAVLHFDVPDPSLISQALLLLRSFGNQERNILKKDKLPAIDNDIGTSTGMTAAFQIVEDLLRFAPTSWFGADDFGFHGAQDIKEYDYSSNVDSVIKFVTGNLAMNSEDIEFEQTEQYLDIIREINTASNKLNHDRFDHDEQMVMDILRLDKLTLHPPSDDSRNDLDNILMASYDGELFESDPSTVVDVILLSLRQSVTQAQGIETLKTLETLIVGNDDLMTAFIQRKGCQLVSDMIINIENNLEFLKPRMDESKAVARGQQIPSANSQRGNVVISSVLSHPSSSSMDSKLPNDDKYYSQVMASLVNLITNSIASSTSSQSHMNPSTVLFNVTQSMYEHVLGCLVHNYHMLTVLGDLLLSGHSTLILVALRAINILIFASKENALTCETAGLTDILLIVIGTLTVAQSIPVKYDKKGDLPDKRPWVKCQLNNGISSRQVCLIHRLSTDIAFADALFSECLGILQVISVIESKRNVSIISYLISILSMVDIASTVYQNPKLINEQKWKSFYMNSNGDNLSTTSKRDDSSVLQCQYCESDVAVLECLRCAQDGLHDCFRLCPECDRVFHKASAKKCHIRIPLHPSLVSCASLSIYPIKSTIISPTLRSLAQTLDSKCNHALDISIQLSSLGHQSRTNEGVDPKHILLLNSIRGLLDDRVSRSLYIPSFYLEPFSLLLKKFRVLAKSKSDPKRGQDFSKLFRISDFRDDLMNLNPYDIVTQPFDVYEKMSPPEDISTNEHRIVMVLLLQCIARCCLHGTDCYMLEYKLSRVKQTSQDNLGSNDSQSMQYERVMTPHDGRTHVDKRKLMTIFYRCGLDGLLVMFLIAEKDNHQETNFVTSSDRQFILWLLRECCIIALECDSNDSMVCSLLRWFVWMIGGNIDHDLYNNTMTTNHMAYPQITSDYPKSYIPLVPPLISVSTRLMMIQELNLLFSTSSVPLKIATDCHHLLRCPSVRIPCSIPILPPPTRNPSFEQLNTTPQQPTPQTTLTMQRQAAYNPFLYHSAVICEPLLQSAMNMGLVTLLTRITFGDLCHRQLHHIFLEIPQAGVIGANESIILDELGDLHIEEWWSSLKLWSIVIASNSVAKDEIQANNYVEIKTIIKILLFIAQTASKNTLLVRSSNESLHNNLLLTVFSLLFDSNHWWNYQSYAMITCRWPVSVASSSSCDTSDLLPLSTQNGDQINANKEILMNSLLRLFRRDSLNHLRLPSPNDEYSSDHTSAEELVFLSPVYFIRPRALASILSLLKPNPLFAFEFLKDDWRKYRSANGFKVDKVSHRYSSSTTQETTWPSLWQSFMSNTTPGPNSLGIYSGKSDGDSSNHGTESLTTSSVPTTRKRNFSQSNLFTTVNHMTSYGYNESDQWEVESSLTSNAGEGMKGSQHSYSSLAALSSALFSQSSHNNGTPNTSLHGENMSSHNNNSRGIRMNNSLSKAHLARTSSKDDPDIYNLEKIAQECVDQVCLASFPPMTQNIDESLTTNVYLSMISSASHLSTVAGVNLLEKYLLFIHNTLSMRFGFAPDILMSEEEFEANKAVKYHDNSYSMVLIAYKLMLKKHLSMFLNPYSLMMYSSFSDALSASSHMRIESLYQPDYSSWIIRNEICVQQIVSLLIETSFEESNGFIVEVLKDILANPENVYAIIKQEKLVLSLIDEARTQRQKRSMILPILLRLFQHNIPANVLQQLIQMVYYPSNEDESAISSDSGLSVSKFSSNIDHPIVPLFLLENCGKRMDPSYFFKFGGIEHMHRCHLSINSMPKMTLNQFPHQTDSPTLLLWIRSGSIGNFLSPVGLIAQMYSPSDDCNASQSLQCLNIFYRSVHRHTTRQSKTNDHEASSTASGPTSPKPSPIRLNTANDEISQSNSSEKQLLQLCISLRNKPAGDVHSAENYLDKFIQETLKELQYKSSIGSKGNRFELNQADISGSSSFSDNPAMQTSVIALLSTMTGLSVPDLIVDYEWTDHNAWHLLALSFHDSKIECFINGIQRDLLYWTPMGYEKIRPEKRVFHMNTDSQSIVKDDSLSVDNKISISSNAGMTKAKDALNKLISKPSAFKFPTISETNPLEISLHGQSSDKESIDMIINMIETLSMHLTTSPINQDASDLTQSGPNDRQLCEFSITQMHFLLWLLNAHQTLTNSFSGSIGNVCVVDGSIDPLTLTRLYSYGPSSDFNMRNMSSNSLKSLQILGSILPESFRTLSHANKHSDTSNGSQIGPWNAFKVYQSESMFASMVTLGGYQIFTKLLSENASKYLKTVISIISNLITKGIDTFAERLFVDSNYNLVIDYALYNMTTNERDIHKIWEICAILFDNIIFTVNTIKSTNISQARCIAVIENRLLLNYLIDLAVECDLFRDISCRIIDWLCEVAEDYIENAKGILNTAGIFSFLHLLSLSRIVSESKAVETSLESPAMASNRVQGKKSSAASADNATSFLSQKIVEKQKKDMTKKDAIGQSHDFDSRLSADEKKLQVSCGKLIRILITGTSGQHLEFHHGLGDKFSLDTSWSCHHFYILLTHVLSSVREYSMLKDAISTNELQSNAVAVDQSSGRRKLTENASNILSDQKRRTAKINSARIALESIVSSLKLPRIGLLTYDILKQGFLSIEQLWYLLLEIFIKGDTSIKLLSMDLLSLSFLSQSDGTLDAALVAQFDRLNGFHLLVSDYESNITNDIEDRSISEAFLRLLTWNYGLETLSENLIERKPMIQHKPAVQATDSLIALLSTHSPGNTIKLARTDSSSQTATAAGSSLLSIFSWGTSANHKSPHSRSILSSDDSNHLPTTVLNTDPNIPSHQPSHPSQAVSVPSKLDKDDPRDLKSIERDDLSRSPMIPRPDYSQAKRVSSPISLLYPLDEANDNTGRQISTPRDILPIYQAKYDTKDQKPSEFKPLTDYDAIDDMKGSRQICETSSSLKIPSAIISIIQILSNFKSPDCFSSFVSTIEKSILISETKASSYPSENLRNLINLSDLMPLTFECIGKQLDKLRQVQLQDRIGATGFDESDSVSVNSLIFSDTDTDVSGIESDGDTNSQYSMFQSQYLPQNSHKSIANREESRILFIVNQLIKFVRLLIIQDIIMNSPSNNLFWKEIFHVPSPESNEVQILICLDLVYYMKHCLRSNYDNAFIIISNISQIIQQYLEKLDVPVEFSVKVLHVIHSLHYQCPPEIRKRLQTTTLPLIRSELVLRVIFDRSEDFYTRVGALHDIRISLQTYLSSSNGTSLTNRLISDTNILLAILTMFLEAYDEIEFIASDITSRNNDVMSTSPTVNIKYPKIPASPAQSSITSPNIDPTHIIDRLQILLDTMQTIIMSIQLCVHSSIECKKLMTKIISDVPGDQGKYLSQIFTDNDQFVKQSLSAEDMDNDSYEHDQKHTSFLHKSSTTWWGNKSLSQYQGSDDERSKYGSFDTNPIATDRTPNSIDNARVIPDFMDWYLSPDSKAMHLQVKSRIIKEVKSSMRQVEKYWDRIMTAKTKHQRQSHDKALKMKQRNEKNWKESYDMMINSNDESISSMVNESQDWITRFKERCRVGQEIFKSQTS